MARNVSEKRDTIICPGCKKERPSWRVDMDADARRRYVAQSDAYRCCNPECRGDWGTNCYHCHHPEFRRSDPKDSVAMISHERHAILLAFEGIALDQPLACPGCDLLRKEVDLYKDEAIILRRQLGAAWAAEEIRKALETET